MLKVISSKELAEIIGIDEKDLADNIRTQFKGDDKDFAILGETILITENGVNRIREATQSPTIAEKLLNTIDQFFEPAHLPVPKEEEQEAFHYDDTITFIKRENDFLVSTREVAKNMGKEHNEILKKIHGRTRGNIRVNGILDDFDSGVNTLHYFIPSKYKDGSGKDNTEYLLTRDGFSLLVMGMTGASALQWKIKYIKAFNEMEEFIRQNLIDLEKLPPITQALLRMEQKTIALEEQMEVFNDKFDNLAQCLLIENGNEKASIKKIINKLVLASKKTHKEIYDETYNLLNAERGTRLDTRLENAKKRLMKSGATATEANKLTKLDIIIADKDLLNAYKTVLATLTSNYNV